MLCSEGVEISSFGFGGGDEEMHGGEEEEEKRGMIVEVAVAEKVRSLTR